MLQPWLFGNPERPTEFRHIASATYDSSFFYISESVYVVGVISDLGRKDFLQYQLLDDFKMN